MTLTAFDVPHDTPDGPCDGPLRFDIDEGTVYCLADDTCPTCGTTFSNAEVQAIETAMEERIADLEAEKAEYERGMRGLPYGAEEHI